MNAEQRRRAEDGAGTIESIALEALSSGATSGEHPPAHSDHRADELPLGQTQHIGRNMEYVDGQWIDEYCDSHQLDVPARLKLFKQVCQAVHFAHQHAIIHRDLKPGNILVTSDGAPKIIDFGIAKLVHGESENDPETEGLATSTRTAESVLAPEFASPEQVKGETITTASDIYALGVVLYVLLTGRRPYWLKTGDTSEVLKAICEQVPEKPSAIAVMRGSSPERLKRMLSGDLDAIVLMAMRKEPERRYGSAEQFADDVECYLKGLPVRAHQDSVLYRAVKFMRRHAVAVIISGVLVSALIAGVVATVTGLILARRERDRAEDSFRRARLAVNHFFTRVSQERLLDQPGLHPLRKALLEDAQQFYEDFLRQRGGDPTLRAELARARTHVAQISSVTGSTTEAISQFQQAIALWENLVAAQPTNPAHREDLARALNEHGLLIMHLNGRLSEALRIFRRAQDLIEPHVALSHSATAGHELSMILLNIGKIQREQGQPQEAIKSIQRSLVIESQLTTEDPSSLDSLITMAKGYALLGQIRLGQSEEFEPALVEYQQAVLVLEKVTRLRPELSDQAFELALFLGDLNRLQQMAGKLDSALTSAGKAMEILERLDRQYPSVLNFEEGLASIYNMMCDLHRRRREPAEALAFVQKAQTLLARLVGVHPENVNLRLDLAKSQNNLGRLLQQTGEPVEALRSFQHAIDLYESMPELDPRNSYNLACNVALSIPLIGVKNGSGETIDVSKLSKGDLLRRERYGNRAVELLHRAVGEGFLKLEIIQSDIDLDPIRDRSDFQSLMDEVAAKTNQSKK